MDIQLITKQFLTLKTTVCKLTFMETLTAEEIIAIRDTFIPNTCVTVFEKILFFAANIRTFDAESYELFKKFISVKKFPKHFWSNVHKIECKGKYYNCSNSVNLMQAMQNYFESTKDSDDMCIKIWEDLKSFTKMCAREYKVKKEDKEQNKDFVKRVMTVVSDDLIKMRGLLDDNL